MTELKSVDGSRELMADGCFATVSIDPKVLQDNLIVGFDRRGARSRPYRLLRTQITKRLVGDARKMIGITSATPGAGKSFTAVNLAAALSCLPEVRVVLVDLDFRKASVGKVLGINPAYGVQDAIAGQIELTSAGFKISETNLVVFPSRIDDSGGSELLSTGMFQKFLERLSVQFEGAIFIFDLPPVFADDDAVIACGALAGYMLVVESGVTSRIQVTECLARMYPSKCIGVVLNRHADLGLNDNYGPYGYTY